jgi:hypothetical protein
MLLRPQDDELKAEDRVQEIINWLKPLRWREIAPQAMQLVEMTVRLVIETCLPEELELNRPDTGYRSENKKHAQRVLRKIRSLQEEFSDSSLDGFFASLAYADITHVPADEDDLGEALWMQGKQIDTLRHQLQHWAQKCENAIISPQGLDRRTALPQLAVVAYAEYLIRILSEKKRTVENVNALAKILWWAVTREPERDFERTSTVFLRRISHKKVP